MWLFVWDTAPSKIFVGWQQASKVFVGSTQVRPTWPAPRTPWANTLAYYPFTDDYNDHSGNGYNVTSTNNTRLTTLALTGVKCLDLNDSYCTVDITNTPLLMNGTIPYTIVFWTLWKNQYWTRTFAINWREAGAWGWSGITAPTSTDYSSRNNLIECRNWYYGSSSVPEGWHISKWATSNMSWAYWNSGVWNCFVVSYTTNWLKVYFDGSHVSVADTPSNYVQYWTYWPQNNGSPLKIWQRQDSTVCGNWYISSVIIEDKEWTAQDAADFYDTTKSYYWIS